MNENCFHLNLAVTDRVLKFNGSMSEPWLEITQGWNLAVLNGQGQNGPYYADAHVPITATIPSAMEFIIWVIPSVYGGVITDPYSVSTVFVMPNSDAAVVAYLKDVAAGGSGNSDNSLRVLFGSVEGTFIQPVQIRGILLTAFPGI